MASLSEIRQQYPQYSDMSDQAIADALYSKSYSDMSRSDFDASIGMTAPKAEPEAAPETAQIEPGFFSMRADSDTADRNKNYRGSILPLSTDAEGNPRLDWNQGITGFAKRAIQLPEQVYSGEVDPTSEEGARRTLEAATAVTPLSAVSRAGGVLAPKTAFRQPETVAPTRAAIKEATDAGYNEARNLGAEYTPKSISNWADEAIRALDEGGNIAPNYPEIHNLLNTLRDVPSGAKSISLNALDAIYKQLGKLGGSPDAAKASAANMVKHSFDEYHQGMGPMDLVSGTASPQRAAQILKDARGNAAAGFRSDRVTGLEQTAARRTAAANSGRNSDNNIRQRLTSLIESNKGSRGLSEGEKQAIDDIIFGRPLKNAYRYIGNMLGGGGGLGSTVLSAGAAAGGAATMGPMGAALALLPPAIGAGTRGAANRMTQKELSMLDELMRSRSPLANSTPRPMPVYQPGIVQGGVELGGRGLIEGQLPVYRPKIRPEPARQPGGMTQEMMRALLASPGGA